MRPQQVGPSSGSICKGCSRGRAPRGWIWELVLLKRRAKGTLPLQPSLHRQGCRQREATALLSYNKWCFWSNSEQFPFKRLPFKKNNNPFFLRPECRQKKLGLFSRFSCETVSGGTIWFLFLQFFCVFPFVSKNEHIQAWEKEVKSDCIAFLWHIWCNARFFFSP